MDRDTMPMDELQRMKKKMEQTWGELFEERPGKGQDGEEFPKFEGTKRTSRPRSKKPGRSHEGSHR